MVHANFRLGSDPEAFFQKDGKIIGTEKVLPPDGLGGRIYKGKTLDPQVVLDGVQLEMHPLPANTVSGAVLNVRHAIYHLEAHLMKMTDVSVCFKPVVEVGLEEIMSLTPDSQQLNCKPSENIYGYVKKLVDPLKYRKRSAGGHIHFGLSHPIYNTSTDINHRLRLVPLCDAIIGNTCVLLDQDPGQRERRKLYGRAGEYRTPDYGLEYRTLSNFWLRSPVLAEFVFGLAELSVNLLTQTLMNRKDMESELVNLLNWDKIVEAIMKNDRKLAKKNWELVRGFIMGNFPTGSVVNAGNMEWFDLFLAHVEEKGLNTFFPPTQEAVFQAWKQNLVSFDGFLKQLRGANGNS